MTHGEMAEKYFYEGYNCAQSVTLAFAPEMGLTAEEAARLSSSFGAGFGRLREICGCVSGMALAAGAIYGYDSPKATEEKAAHYALIQELAAEFKAEAGSLICRELLAGVTTDTAPSPEARTDAYYKKRPCPRLVRLAADIFARRLKEMDPDTESFKEFV